VLQRFPRVSAENNHLDIRPLTKLPFRLEPRVQSGTGSIEPTMPNDPPGAPIVDQEVVMHY
jgi:hypothetical protein